MIKILRVYIVAVALLLISGCVSLKNILPSERSASVGASLVDSGHLVAQGPCKSRSGRWWCRAYEVESHGFPTDTPGSVRRIAIHDPITDKLIAVTEVIDRDTGRQRTLLVNPESRSTQIPVKDKTLGEV